MPAEGLEIHVGTSNLCGEGLENLGTLRGLHPHTRRESAFQSSIPKDRGCFLSFFIFLFFFYFLIPFQGRAALWEQARKSATDGWEFHLQQSNAVEEWERAASLGGGGGDVSRALWLRGGRGTQGTGGSLSPGSRNAGEEAGGRRRGGGRMSTNAKDATDVCSEITSLLPASVSLTICWR